MPFDKADEMNEDSKEDEKEASFKMNTEDRTRSYSIVVETCQDNTSEKSLDRDAKESLFDSNPNLLCNSTLDTNRTDEKLGSNIDFTRNSSNFHSREYQLKQNSQNTEITEQRMMILE